MSSRATTLVLLAAILGVAALAAVPAAGRHDMPLIGGDRGIAGDLPTPIPHLAAESLGQPTDRVGEPPSAGPASRAGVVDRPEPLHLAVAAGLAAEFADGVTARLRAGALGMPVSVDPAPDRLAIERVLTGEVSAALTTRPPSPREVAGGLGEEFVGTWVPVVIVHPSNPLRSLTAAQLRELLRGAIDDWSGVGGAAGAVHRILPPAGPRADLVSRALLPGDRFGAARTITDPRERLRCVAADPLAVSVVAMPLAERHGAPRLRIDGVPPDLGTVRLGRYRFGLPVYLVFGGHRDPRLPGLIAAVRAGGLVPIAVDELVPSR